MGDVVKLDASQLARAFADLKTVDKALVTDLRRDIKKIAKPAETAVKQAAGFSPRIAASVKTRVKSGRNASVEIYSAARGAAPLDHRGKGGTFRHPVYGGGDKTRDEWTWVSQQARPFTNAAEAALPAVEQELFKTIDAALRKAGFR